MAQLGYQHVWKSFPQLGEKCQICARTRTPENEALECMKPETLDIKKFMEQYELL